MTTNFCEIWQIYFWFKHLLQIQSLNSFHAARWQQDLLASRGPKFHEWQMHCSWLDGKNLSDANKSLSWTILGFWLSCGHSLCKLLYEKATKMKCLLGDHHHHYPPKFQRVVKMACAESAQIATLSKGLKICSVCECRLEMLIIPTQYNNVLRALQQWHEQKKYTHIHRVKGCSCLWQWWFRAQWKEPVTFLSPFALGVN